MENFKTFIAQQKQNYIEKYIKYVDNKILGNIQIAENFNSFYVNSINDLVNKITALHECVSDKIRTLQTLFSEFTSIIIIQLKKYIKNLR